MEGTEVVTIPKIRQVIYTTYAAFPTINLVVGDLAYATDKNILYYWDGSAWQPLTSGIAGEGHILISPRSYSAIGQGTWAFVADGTHPLALTLDNNAAKADGDNISYKAYLDVGTYTLLLYYMKSTDCGIIDIDLDGVEIGSIDTYNVAPLKVQVYVVAAISVTVSGLKTIRIRVDGKNGASADFRCILNAIELYRTA